MAKWRTRGEQKPVIENTGVLFHITRSYDKYLQEPLDTFNAIFSLRVIHSATLLEVKHTRTHKVVDYITHWPLGSPVNIIDSCRMLALPMGLHGKILFPLCLLPSFPASLSNQSFNKRQVICHKYVFIVQAMRNKIASHPKQSQEGSCSVTHVVLQQARHFTTMPFAGHAGYTHTCKNTPEISSVHVTPNVEKQP